MRCLGRSQGRTRWCSTVASGASRPHVFGLLLEDSFDVQTDNLLAVEAHRHLEVITSAETKALWNIAHGLSPVGPMDKAGVLDSSGQKDVLGVRTSFHQVLPAIGLVAASIYRVMLSGSVWS